MFRFGGGCCMKCAVTGSGERSWHLTQPIFTLLFCCVSLLHRSQPWRMCKFTLEEEGMVSSLVKIKKTKTKQTPSLCWQLRPHKTGRERRKEKSVCFSKTLLFLMSYFIFSTPSAFFLSFFCGVFSDACCVFRLRNRCHWAQLEWQLNDK